MTDISTLGIAVDSSQVRKGAQDLDNLAAAGGRAEKSTLSITSASSRLAGALGVVAGALASLGISRFISETANLSQRYDELGIVLGTVSRNAGLATSDVLKTADAVRKSGISMIESRQIVSRLVTANIDLSKATELARLAQDAAVIGQINSSEALDRMVHGITSAQVEVLRGIGINVNFERSYASLAREMGVTASSLTEQQKLQARLNVVLGEATKLTGIYENSMANAGKQMRSTERLVEDLKVKIGGLFDQTSIFAVTAYTNALKDTDSAVDGMTETGRLRAWGDAIARIAAFAADSIRSVGIVFDITGKAIGALAAQAVSISKFDFSGASKIRIDFGKDLDASIASMSKMRDLVESQIIQRNLLVPAIERETKAIKLGTEETESRISSERILKRSKDDLNKSQQNTLRIESEYIKLLDIEKKQRQDLLAPYKSSAKQASDNLSRMDDEISALKLVRDRQIDLQQAVELTTVAKLEEKRASVKDPEIIKQINAEIDARRRISDLIPIHKSIEQQARSTTSQVSQLWIQAGRNIQTSLSSSIFAFFDTGLSGMVDSVKRAVMQITAEFAALKIGQTLGLDKIFGINSGIGGTGSAGSGIQNILGLGGLFGKGNATQLAAQRGSLALWGSTGTSSGGLSSLMGAAGGLSSVAGALGALGLSVGIGSSIAGKNKIGGLGGTEMSLIGAAVAGPLGAIVGGAINKLFGREPYKFRQQSLQGTASIGGFDGDITNVFRSKGGLFMSNKHKSVSQALTQEQQDVFDTALNGFYGSAHKFAENLGLDVDLVDGFTKEFQIKSEKNQQLTSEAIEEMLSGLGNDIAKNALPIVDSFRKAGEDSYATLNRLSGEFTTLQVAVQNLGASSEFARQIISKLSIQQRTDTIEMAGGAERLMSSTEFFFNNILTDSERFELASNRVKESLKNLGLSQDLSLEQTKQLIQSTDTSNEVRLGLLAFIEDLYSVRTAADSVGGSLKDLAGIIRGEMNKAFDALKNAVSKERQSITERYNSDLGAINTQIQSVTNSVSKLKSFSDSLKSTVNDLAPMNREFAKRIVGNSIKSGNFDSPQLQFAIDRLKDQSTDGFTSSGDFKKEQIKAANLLSDLGSSADKQLESQKSYLSSLENQSDLLTKGFNNQIDRLDSILEQAQMQSDSLSGINTSILDLTKAISQFNLKVSQAGGLGITDPFTGQSGTTGNTSISDQQIVNFANKQGITDMDLYNAAKSNGVSFEQFSAATGKNLQDLYKWADERGLPKFETGTSFVPKTGLAVVHKGERVIPANQNSDLRKSMGNDDVVAELRMLKSEFVKVSRILSSVTPDGNSIKVNAA